MLLKQLIAAKLGSYIKLDDEASLLLSSQNGRGLKALEYRVVEILRVEDSHDFAKWLFLTLKGDFNEVTIMAKIVGEDFDLYRFLLANSEDKFPVKNRQENLDAENYWLFLEPQGEWTANSLKYTTAFPEDTADGKRFNYAIKKQGERTGPAYQQPALQGVGQLIATVVEYTSPDEEGREALILELGSEHSDEGGVIRLFTGKRIGTNDIDVFNR